MKKYLFFTFSLFFASGLFSQGQTFLIEFEIGRSPQKLNPKDLSGMSDQMIKMVMDRRKEMEKVRNIYILTTSGQKSKYIFSHTEAPSTLNTIHTGMEYYKDFDSNMIIAISPTMPPDTKIEIKMPAPDQWILVDGPEEKICEYMCKKAVSLDGKVTAWYTEQIPYSDGPGKYCGLPGLILKIETKSKRTFVARKLTISNENEEIVFPQRPKSISLEKFKSTIGVRG